MVKKVKVNNISRLHYLSYLILSLILFSFIIENESFFFNYYYIDKLLLFINTNRYYLLITSFIIILISIIINKTSNIKHKNKIKKIKTMEKLNKLHWREFEEMLASYFASQGYKVILVGGSGGDNGIDLILYKKRKKTIVQAKHYSTNIGVKVIREMYGVMFDQKANQVFICSNAGYTNEAIKFAKNKPIRLIDGLEIINNIKNK